MECLVCNSNKVYASVGEWTERKEWLSVDVQALTLQECVKGCYEYRHCYSITWDEKQQIPCNFRLHLSDQRCKQRELKAVTEIHYENQPLFVECLRCVSDEEASESFYWHCLVLFGL